jgi:UDP-N-acetylmuramoyl-tripeptide--D-alanyl-D-alanine ligase
MTFLHLAALPQFIVLIGFAYFSYVRLHTLLHIFQQEEYDNVRFLKWIVKTGSIDRKASIVVAAAWLCGQAVAVVIAGPLAAVLVVIAYAERKAQKKAKKPLVMTKRAMRIFCLAWAVALLAGAAAALTTASLLVWLLPVQLCPAFLVAANLLLSPLEARLKAGYWREAHEKIVALGTFVIGVTGSYGKTSTKHILGHILQFYAPTFITPGSVNTQMGVSRIIREQLQPKHKYIVVEMGAYGIGSIARLCRLTPPQLGIVTAVGVAHLERFGSREAIAKAKMELAAAATENGGAVVLNADLLSLAAVSGMVSAAREKYVTCGGTDGDLRIGDVCQTKAGLELTVAYEGQEYRLATPLFGTHHALNVGLAFAAARKVGMPGPDIVRALKTVPQISHRLEVRRRENGATVIDDAYNSNPSGFESALHLIRFLKEPDGRSYLITPGMVELGALHDAEHRRLGELAGQCVDEIYAVAPQRIPTFIAGAEATSSAAVHRSDTFQSAYADVLAKMSPRDVLLMENDLPDLYEHALKL